MLKFLTCARRSASSQLRSRLYVFVAKPHIPLKGSFNYDIGTELGINQSDHKF